MNNNYLMSNGKYCNQWTINSKKEKVEKASGAQRPYLIAYTDTITKAAKNLKGNTFMVWMWLLCNKEGSTMDYSPKYLAAALGISEDCAKKAKTTLVDEGYLVPTENPHIYNFFDAPQEKPKVVPKLTIKVKKKFFLDAETGEYVCLSYEELAQNMPGTPTSMIQAYWDTEGQEEIN